MQWSLLQLADMISISLVPPPSCNCTEPGRNFDDSLIFVQSYERLTSQRNYYRPNPSTRNANGSNDLLLLEMIMKRHELRRKNLQSWKPWRRRLLQRTRRKKRKRNRNEMIDLSQLVLLELVTRFYKRVCHRAFESTSPVRTRCLLISNPNL